MSKYSNLSKEITAGVLSAMLSFGSHTAGNYVGNSAAAKYEQSASKPRYTSNYSNQLVSWLDQVGYGSNSELTSAFMSNMSDTQKYEKALKFYHELGGKSSANKIEDSFMHLELKDTSNGCYAVDRRKGYVVATLKKTPSGMLFTGPKEYITFFGGRNEGGGMADRIYDGVFNNKN